MKHMSIKCRIQADRFFNAYEILQQNDNDFFEQVSAACQTGTQLPSDILETIGVNIVCLSFSLELYLKDLHFILTGEYPRGHEIIVLFEKLPENIQQDIFAYHAKKRCMTNFAQLQKEITQISKGFQQWRYSYEFSTLRYEEGFVIDLIKSIKICADRIRYGPITKSGSQ